MAYTTRQLAEAAGVTMSRIRQLCISGELRCEKFGHVWLIPDDEAERFLADRKANRHSPDSQTRHGPGKGA